MNKKRRPKASFSHLISPDAFALDRGVVFQPKIHFGDIIVDEQRIFVFDGVGNVGIAIKLKTCRIIHIE